MNRAEFLRFQAEAKKGNLQAKDKKSLVDDSGVTEISLEYFKNNRTKLGNVKSVNCSGQSLRLHGDKNDMKLTGCTSGYSGEGPRGTASILQALGFSEKEAARLSGLDKFEVEVHGR